jgi:hypothetical protein
MYIPAANLFAGGILRGGNTNFTIVSNTAGPGATVTIRIADEMLPVSIALYVNLGNNAPATIVDPNGNDADLYTMLQPTTVRAQNRYADAYLQPELEALNQFDSNNVTPTSHSPAGQAGLRALADHFRGTNPGGPARPDDYETDFFWSVYVLAGFEPQFNVDGDPDDGLTIFGHTDGGPGDPKQITMVYLEALRDRFFNALDPVGPGVTPSLLRARVTVHEIGHQLQIAMGLPDEHRDPPVYPPNIMQSDAGAAADGDFYLHPADIVTIRERIFSPGS